MYLFSVPNNVETERKPPGLLCGASAADIAYFPFDCALFAPSFYDIVFYKINNSLVFSPGNKMHKLLVSFAINDNRSVRDTRHLMTIHVGIKDMREERTPIFLHRQSLVRPPSYS